MLEQITEAIYKFFHMNSKIWRFYKSLHERDDCHSELDEVISNKADLVFHALYNWLDKLRVFEDSFTVSLRIITIEMALKENNFQQVHKLNLHSIVLIVNGLSKCLQDGINNDVSDLICNFFLCL